MNTEEAKSILAAVRPGMTHIADADEEIDTDSAIRAALALVDSDSDLREWYQQEQALDEVISGKLNSIEPPAELRHSLLRLLEPAEPELEAEAEPESLPASNGARGDRDSAPANLIAAWLRPGWLAAAAAVILVPLAAIQLFTGDASARNFDTFRSDMVEIASGHPDLDHRENDLEKLYSWLAENNAICPPEMPDCLGCDSSVGCKLIDWGEQQVTLICLRNGSDEVVHCFVIPIEEFEKLPNERKLRESLTVESLETTSWTDAKHLFLLIGSTKEVHVKAPMIQEESKN